MKTNREIALDHAVSIAHVTDDVVKLAESFLAFLNGDQVAEEPAYEYWAWRHGSRLDYRVNTSTKKVEYKPEGDRPWADSAYVYGELINGLHFTRKDTE